MRETTNLFQINGIPMLVPDMPVGMSYEDVDGSDAGRDESGYMHRVMVRCKVGVWSFTYSHLTEAEKRYMESLFGEEPTFTFTHPDRTDSPLLVQTQCYRSKYSLSWRNARTGLWTSYGFNIIAC